MYLYSIHVTPTYTFRTHITPNYTYCLVYDTFFTTRTHLYFYSTCEMLALLYILVRGPPSAPVHRLSSWPEGRDFVEVYVSSVANPDTFFVQILTSMSLQLDEVVKEMSQYYCKEREVRGGLSQVIIPHATSCGGYNVFDPSVSQSVCQSVRQSCFTCQRNSSETAQQNFLKLCINEGHSVYMHISTTNFDSIFFPELHPF